MQGERRAGSDRGISRSRAPLRLSAAPRPHRGRHGFEGHRRLHRGHGGAAAGGHRRHDPHFAHARAGRRPHAGSHRRAGDPADHGPALVCADGDRVPGLRAHHQHRISRNWPRASRLPAPADAGVARAVSGRGGDARRGHGLRGQRPGRSKHANIGISLPGTGETPVAPVFVDGQKTVTLKGERIAEEFQEIVEDYVRTRYGAPVAQSSRR